MEILNTVIELLQLIATIVFGTIQVTQMTTKDIFHDSPKAKHYSQDKK